MKTVLCVLVSPCFIFFISLLEGRATPRNRLDQ